MRICTRGEHEAFALHRWLADRLWQDPSQLELPRRRLECLRSRHPAGAAYYDQWDRLLHGPLEDAPYCHGEHIRPRVGLRQEGSFVDLMDQGVRARIYRTVAHTIDRGGGA